MSLLATLPLCSLDVGIGGNWVNSLAFSSSLPSEHFPSPPSHCNTIGSSTENLQLVQKGKTAEKTTLEMDKSYAWSSFLGDYLTPRHMFPWWQFHVSLIFFCSSLLFLLSFRLPPTHGRSVLRLPFNQWIVPIIHHWENNFPKAKMHIFTLRPLLILHFGVHGNVLNIYCKCF